MGCATVQKAPGRLKSWRWRSKSCRCRCSPRSCSSRSSRCEEVGEACAAVRACRLKMRVCR
ncbi:hypothetical protein BCR35DRAFT_303691 [Leucosporidium creatinivorum]|uniref:Uncharacterized protein n=1 Tax=Leucosporidium creatinivorum TaxID=106004 RepID=A0A1Y2FEH2_9BASI|nr:hypothetical protein BCR35DRAFT_303691 [Leucosporidium creatinivorum]